MQIAIHLGAHRTDEDLLLQTFLRNEDSLNKLGIAIPPARRARPAIRKAAQASGQGGLDVIGQDALLAEMLGKATPNRVILSYEAFLGIYAKVLAGGRIYADAGQRARLLRDLFPEHEVSFFLALRNPATFIPAVFEASSINSLAEFVAGQDLAHLRWSHPIKDIRAACPDVPLTIWCNEDLPLLLPEVLDAIAPGHGPFDGDDAMLAKVMTDAGHKRFRGYLRDNPTTTRATWRKVATAFLGKYADPDVVEPEITTEGWSEEMITGLSAIYEDDLQLIDNLPGVTFLQP